MEIGDKVKFNKYVPITENGQLRTLIIPFTVRVLNENLEWAGEMETRKRKEYPWQIVRTDTTVSWNIKKFPVSEKEGVYIGSLRKKLSRSYRLSEPVSPETRRENRLGRVVNRDTMSGTGLLDQILDNSDIEIPQIITSRRPLNWTTRNPRRIDNPNHLDELAIIAVSKTKRYVVDMKDIVEYNIRNKFKIL